MNSQFSESDEDISCKRIDLSCIRSRKGRTEYIQNYINNEVLKLDMSSSSMDSKCPVYELFSDGTIIYKKDKNSDKEEILFYEIVKPNDFFKFPTSHEKYEGITYGILSYEDCVETRKIMDDLLLQV